MLRSHEGTLKTSLTRKISEWWDEDMDSMPLYDMPYVCPDIHEIMATAALAVLRGIADTQDYVIAERLLVEPTDKDG